MRKNLETKLRQILKNSGDIQIESITDTSVDVLVPYETASLSIELEGNSDDEIIESFKDGVNKRLNEMIDHLNDCKLD